MPKLPSALDCDQMGKILIVAMNYAPEITGCGQYAGDLGAALAERGHDVEVVTTPAHYPGWQVRAPYRNRYASETFKGAEVYRCPLLLKSPMGGIWRLVAPVSFALSAFPVTVWRALARRPDTVLVVEPTLFSAPAALLAAKLTGARSVLHVQDLEVDAAFAVGHLALPSLGKRLGFLFERWCLNGFSSVVTISHRMGEHLLRKGVKAERLHVVRNWVDLGHIQPLPGSVAFRRELGLPEDAYVALYSGNIGPKQGLDVVIEAARLLKHEDGIVFAVAGEGPSKEGLMARAADLPNVRFLPFQPYERLPEFLACCDLHLLPQTASAGDLVLPSKLGGMLASGRPILVTAEAEFELARFLAGAATVVPPEDPQAFAAGVLACRSAPFGAAEKELSARLARQLSREAAMERLEEILLGPVSAPEGASRVAPGA